LEPHRTCLGLGLGLGLGVLALGQGVGAGAASALATPVSDGSSRLSEWAYPQSAGPIRNAPSGHAPAVGRLHFLTEEGQTEVYVAVRHETVAATGAAWIEIMVPRRPNGVTGWIPADALGPLHIARDRLVIDRSTLRATLLDGKGRAIWTAPIGVGRPSLPTPAGHFYVTEKLRAIGGAEYGPFAIGTSAYAPKLSEWPGDGVVGIHGTNEPQLIPGRPSHGCVRLHNADVSRLWSLITVGTPVDIT
jgi:lipoprotein-anchoring transpeptidase ErfK/SrfK